MKTALRLTLGLVMLATSAPVFAQSREGGAESVPPPEADEKSTELEFEPVEELGGGSAEPATPEAAAKAERTKKDAEKRAADDMEALRHVWTDP